MSESGCRREEAALSETYHGPHTVCGSRANRVVVGVCCCIDSAIAAWQEAQRRQSLIYHWPTATHSCFMLNSSKSGVQSVISLLGLLGCRVIPGRSQRTVQRTVHGACLCSVVLIKWIGKEQREESGSWRAGSLPWSLFTRAAHWAHALVFSLLLVWN